MRKLHTIWDQILEERRVGTGSRHRRMGRNAFPDDLVESGQQQTEAQVVRGAAGSRKEGQTEKWNESMEGLSQ